MRLRSGLTGAPGISPSSGLFDVRMPSGSMQKNTIHQISRKRRRRRRWSSNPHQMHFGDRLFAVSFLQKRRAACPTAWRTAASSRRVDFGMLLDGIQRGGARSPPAAYILRFHRQAPSRHLRHPAPACRARSITSVITAAPLNAHLAARLGGIVVEPAQHFAIEAYAAVRHLRRPPRARRGQGG